MSGPLPAPSALPLTLCISFLLLRGPQAAGASQAEATSGSASGGQRGVPQAQEGVPALGGVKPVQSESAEPGAREAAAPLGARQPHGVFCLGH